MSMELAADKKQAEKSSAARGTNRGEDQEAEMVWDFRVRAVFRRWKA